MPRRLRGVCLLGIGLGLFFPAAAPAQEQEIGHVERISEILGGRTEREIREATPKVQIRRAGSEAWESVAPRVPLSSSQNILVQRYVDARLQVDGSAHRGKLVLLPELVRRSGGRVFPAGASQPVQEGTYGLALQPARANELMVSIDRGALVVDWVHGTLIVVAGGTPTVITGTKVAFSTEPDGSGYLFLEEGSVSFPDHPEVTVAPGELVRLRPGVAPEIISLVATDVQAIREAMLYHSAQLWTNSTRFWQRRNFLIPTAGVIAVAGVICAAVCGGDERPPEGTVIIRFPPR